MCLQACNRVYVPTDAHRQESERRDNFYHTIYCPGEAHATDCASGVGIASKSEPNKLYMASNTSKRT